MHLLILVYVLISLLLILFIMIIFIPETQSCTLCQSLQSTGNVFKYLATVM